MITWLVIIILAYFFFSLSNLGDKLILAGPPKPVSYTFYVSVLSLFTIFLIPFANFSVPTGYVMFWIICEALVYILSLYTMYLALEKFEVSKAITTIGAIQPIFIFLLSWIVWGPQKIGPAYLIAFILLLAGSFIISVGKNSKTTENYLRITILSSFLFSVDYVISKIVFLSYPFLSAFIWMKIILFIFALTILINKKSRKEIFNKKKNGLNIKMEAIFFFAYAVGGLGSVLQAYAVSLAPIVFLPIANSLRGIQYVFLFAMTLFLSYFFPKVIKESMSRKIILQKIVSTILIVAGFLLLII